MVVQITFLYACKKYEACEINENYVCLICLQVMFCTHAVMVLKHV